ncbi:MAG TPA: preprotein translocase subunit YajC [Gaiellaceae bacterium]
MGQLIVLVAMFALLWVFLIMPSRRRAQAQRQLIASVEVGDEILTVGGIYGRVLEDRGEDELLVEIAPDMQVRVARRAVAAVLPPEEEPEQLEPSVFEQNEQVRS